MKNYIQILTLFLLSLLLNNCGGGGGINYNSGPSSTGGTFLDSGTSLTYNSTTASNHQAYDPYENVTGSTQSSHQNPFDHINAYKAYGYGYSGDGQQIAIFDSGFDKNHYTFTNKTVTTYGTLTADNSNHGISANHGNFVTSIAAGYLDTSYSGTTVSHGVAYDSDIHLASYDQKGSETYYPEQWANTLDNASSAVVQNNSWGFTDTKYDSGTTYTSANLATYSTASGLTANGTSIDSYVTSLNNFQDHGVIVFAVSNTSTYDDVDIQVAMPEIYSQLNDAWINVVNVDITGSSGNEAYTRKSAPCGSTAKYCVAADGAYISGALDYTSSSSWFSTAGGTGSSFAAPQVSGAVAILAEAFSSQTPAQWTDRLLATADNSMCTASGNVSFANGITHAYCSDYGHGVIDIYAALRPITSSKMGESILIGVNVDTASVYSLNRSLININPAFGDSFSNSLNNKKAFFYDALYGSFEYDYENHIINQSSKINYLNDHLESNYNNLEYRKLNNDPFLNNNIIASFGISDDSGKKIDYEKGISFTSKINNKKTFSSYNYPLELSLGFSEQETISLMDSNNAFSIPYLSEAKNNFSFGSELFQNENSSMSLGYFQTNDKLIDKSALAASYNHQKSNSSFITGITYEQKGFVGTNVSGAFNLENKNSPTTFIGLNHKKQINQKNSYGFLLAAGITNVNNNDNLLENISNIYTSNFGFFINSENIFKDKDKIAFSISQPQRVERGSAQFLIPLRNDINGDLKFDKMPIDLEPSGRQIDLSLKYTNKISNNMSMNFENITTNDKNHTAENKFNNIFIVSLNYKF